MGHTKAALYTAVDPTELQKDYGNPPFYHAVSYCDKLLWSACTAHN